MPKEAYPPGRTPYLEEPVDLRMSHRERHNRDLLLRKHYHNLNKIKPLVNTRDPERAKRMQRAKKYHKLTKTNHRQSEIRRANEQLIGRITDIATSNSNRFKQDAFPGKMRMFMTILAKHGRKARQSKIDRENQQIARRLLKNESQYAKKNFEKSWKRHDQVLNHMSKSTQMGIRKPVRSKNIRRKKNLKSPKKKKRSSLASAGLATLKSEKKSEKKFFSEKKRERKETKAKKDNGEAAEASDKAGDELDKLADKLLEGAKISNDPASDTGDDFGVSGGAGAASPKSGEEASDF